MSEQPLRGVEDTAYWVAVYRARETERPDAHFRDPHARALAGERGRRLIRAMGSQDRNAWSFVARTVLFDELVRDAVDSGVDLVVNLAAGLDARPYRMELPASLRWVEVDRADLLAHKNRVLEGLTPRCAVERIASDLTDGEARRGLFDRLASESRRAFVLCEGLLIYLSDDEVGSLSRDLADRPVFRSWGVDITSPALLKMIRRQIGDALDRVGTPFRFGPRSGPEFFREYGWAPAQVHSLLQTGARLRRVPAFLRLMALLPDAAGRQPWRPWSGVVLLERAPREPS